MRGRPTIEMMLDVVSALIPLGVIKRFVVISKGLLFLCTASKTRFMLHRIIHHRNAAFQPTRDRFRTLSEIYRELKNEKRKV